MQTREDGYLLGANDWQVLAPEVLDIAALSATAGSTGPFKGNAACPANGVVDAQLHQDITSGQGQSVETTVPVGLALANVSRNNFPNPIAPTSLFLSQPAGIGAIPSAIPLQRDGISQAVPDSGPETQRGGSHCDDGSRRGFKKPSARRFHATQGAPDSDAEPAAAVWKLSGTIDDAFFRELTLADAPTR